MTEARIQKAVYAGSFDPPTRGHVYAIREGARLFDELVVAVGQNPDKATTFTLEERLDFLRAITDRHDNVSVSYFENRYLVDYAAEIGADTLLRGIRNSSDLLYEQTLRNVNADINPDISTVFILPPRDLADISSSFVKGLVGPQGWERVVEGLVPSAVFAAFKARA